MSGKPQQITFCGKLSQNLPDLKIVTSDCPFFLSADMLALKIPPNGEKERGCVVDLR